MIEPKKLSALVAREAAAKPFDNPAMYDEDAMVSEYAERAGVEEGEEEEEDELGLDEGITEEEIDEIAEMIEDGKGHPDLMDLAEELAEAVEEHGEPMANPPAWAKDKAKWREAKQAVDPTGAGAKYSEPWAVVSHVYKKLGGTIG